MTPAQAYALRLVSWKAAVKAVQLDEEEASKPALPPKSAPKDRA